MIRTSWTCALLVCAFGCGKSALPPAKVVDTQSSISAAAAVGAEKNPQGALHLKMARDQLQQAQALSADGKEEEARLVIERAQADADLALMLTREEAARGEARKAEQDVQNLSKPN
jgi:hypothetical protein